MKRRILDTSILVRHWRPCRQKARRVPTRADVRRWAQELIDFQDTDAIVTPVAVELLAGVRDRAELELTKAFLGEFQRIDQGNIPRGDWENAIRLAQWIPPNRRPRDLGDCLIRAIASRLHYEVASHDKAFPGHHRGG